MGSVSSEGHTMPRIRDKNHLLRVTRWLLDEWGFEYTPTSGDPFRAGGPLLLVFCFLATQDSNRRRMYPLREGGYRIALLLNDVLSPDVLCQFNRGVLRFVGRIENGRIRNES